MKEYKVYHCEYKDAEVLINEDAEKGWRVISTDISFLPNGTPNHFYVTLERDTHIK